MRGRGTRGAGEWVHSQVCKSILKEQAGIGEGGGGTKREA